MNEETRNQRIAKLYQTADFTIRSIGKRYRVSAERIRQVLVREIGKDGIKIVKDMRRERTAERWKENYINRV